MTTKEKARCGDGLLRCCVMELVAKTDVDINFESNKTLSRCWKSYSDVLPVKKTHWEFGTLMEAEIYQVFLDKGYDSCKEFILDKIVNPTINWHNRRNAQFQNIRVQYELITINR